MYRLEVEPLDLGSDVKAVGLELVEKDEHREPVTGPDAARIWSRVLPAVAGAEEWGIDFFSHLGRVREYCQRHEIPFRETSGRSLLIPAPGPDALEALLARFQNETFGLRAGGATRYGDAELEGELARQGADGYHKGFRKYFFCAICNFESASLVLLTNRLWAAEVIRRVRPAVAGLEVELVLPS